MQELNFLIRVLTTERVPAELVKTASQLTLSSCQPMILSHAESSQMGLSFSVSFIFTLIDGIAIC